MRSAGSVYKKLKEAKYRHLVILYRKYLSKNPENCKYNHKFLFMCDGKEREIRLCLLHQDPPGNDKNLSINLVDICEETKHCSHCNAFIFKYSKEDIKNILETELSDKHIKINKYPDICALEWVLERTHSSIKLNWLSNIYYRIKMLFLNEYN